MVLDRTNTAITMKTFNLISDPWIPVRYAVGGRNSLVSLSTLFSEASQIGDLACPAHERISIMRMLVCITQAALGAPETGDDWCGFGSDMETRVPDYLRRDDIAPHFNLFGDGPRFLQTKNADDSKPYPASQIVFHFATGNSPTLLDHEGSAPRSLSPEFLARSVLTYQNFFVGGSMASKVKGNGPSLKILHTLLVGKSLKESILANCLDTETIRSNFGDMGKPCWETRQQSGGANLTTYLPRLVPLTCALHVVNDGSLVTIDQGEQLPEFPERREAAATVVTKGDELRLLRADLEKGIWKDLHAITVLRHADKEMPRAPLNLQSHFEQYCEDDVTLWLGELVKAKDAKVIDLIESTFTLPPTMFEDRGRRQYEAGVEHAEVQSRQLYGAIKQYAGTLMNESAPTASAQGYFWNALEYQVQVLIDIVRDPSVMEGKSFGEGDDLWTIAVRKAARDAYDHVCGRITPRQLKAYAAGLKVLFPKSKKPKPQKETTSL